MTICIAGKNDIAIEIAEHIRKNFSQHTIIGLTNRSDNGVNGYFRSYKWYLNFKKIPECQLSDVYDIEDLIFLSLEYDRIIKPELFVSQKLFNIHFSLLPAYKGMFTSAWPILNCEKFSGVTLHVIDQGIDTGEIIDQVKFRLLSTETVKSLYKKYMEHGIALMKKNLTALLDGTYRKHVQSHKGSTYYSKNSINYKNLQIDIKNTAERLDAQIRAFAYREYQIPTILGHKVHKSKITNVRSTFAPGTIIKEDEFELTISTIDYNVTLYKDRFDDFISACEKNDLKTVKKLIRHIDIEERTREGWTPLIVACYNNSVETAVYLIQKGANVNAVNYKGTSVVMYAKDAALNYGSTKILDTVLQQKPNVKHRDFFHKNIFDYLQDQSPDMIDYIKYRV